MHVNSRSIYEDRETRGVQAGSHHKEKGLFNNSQRSSVDITCDKLAISTGQLLVLDPK